jgi:glycolate oxidase
MIAMPEPDLSVLARRREIADAMRRFVPDGVVADDETLGVFASDGLSSYSQKPMVCVLPKTVDQVSDVLRYASREGIRVVPRGAGTSLSGGALPLADGILIGLSRMNRILDIDYENRCVVTEPGVTNLAISKAVDARGFFYAPDPSSQIACSVGGNVAENSGGLHCLKYGITSPNLLGVELVLLDGERVRLGGKFAGAGGLDLLGVVTGSEGLLGVVTEATLKIVPKPPKVETMLLAFASVHDAAKTVGAIIAAGIVPAAMEFMDQYGIVAVEAYCSPGYPTDAAAILIVEVDGMAAEVRDAARRVADVAHANRATSVRTCATEEERARVWSGRKGAFPAMAKIRPDMLCMDGTIPRKALPEVLDAMNEMSARFGLGFCNVFHAGDGNLHPCIVFDVMKDGDLARAEEFGAEILRLCVKKGGVLSGEHGIGIEKRDLMDVMFTETELAQQERLKCAFDGQGLLNPGKVFPSLSACVEQGRMHVHQGRMPFGNLPRL